MIDALPLLLGPEGYQISRSVRLRSSASAYLNRTFAGSGTDLKRWTVSFWMKRGALGVQSIPFSSQDTPGTGASSLYLILSSSNTIGVFYPNTGSVLNVGTSAVLRDPSAWYHIVFSWDSTQATSTDRIKIYINGVQQTLAAGGTYPSLNATTTWNSNCAHFISKNPVSSSDYFDGYITEINSIDGQALTPASFGETNAVTGVWQPKKYTGTYGTNGFYLNFSDNSAATAAAIGKDNSGNGNNWTPNNISVTAGVTYDSMLDVPTQWADGGNGRGNYAVLNPVDKASLASMSDGNLKLTNASAGDGGTRSTITCHAGTCYAELIVGSTTNANSAISFGLISTTVGIGAVSGYNTANAWTIYASNVSQINNSGSITGSGAVFSAGDILQVAFDRTNNRAWVGKNNVWYDSSFGTTGNPSAGTNATFSSIPTTNDLAIFAYAYANSANANFGQRPFAYTPPSGFKALNTLNLPTPTILKGNQYFDATIYTGTGAAQSIVNSGAMQPDFVWMKQRSAINDHILMDSVRGVTKALFSNLTNAEVTDATRLTSFNSNGFTLGTSASTNTNAGTYVGWQWKEGATQGFDIVTYTGDGTSARAISHSLGVAPKMIIIKQRNAGTYGWVTYHASVGAGSYLTLNGTGAAVADTAMFNNTAPTSSVFTLSSGGNIVVTNPNTGTMVAYLFAEVAGFSKFGSYTGNGSADGPFVFCGFRPRFILIKESTPNARGWRIFDTARSPFNQAGLTLSPNTADAEDTGSGLYNQMDILSNGFKLRAGTNSEPTNESGATYIYAAFSEVGFKYSLGR